MSNTRPLSFQKDVLSENIQISGTGCVLGRFSIGSGSAEELILGENFSVTGNVLNVAPGPEGPEGPIGPVGPPGPVASTIVVVVGDSTAAHDTGTRGSVEPGSVGPYYGYPSGTNPENWFYQLSNELSEIGSYIFVNLAVGGRTLVQVDAAFESEIAPYLPAEGQNAILIICGGYNDNYQDRTAAQIHASAVSIRTKANSLGFRSAFITPKWTTQFASGGGYMSVVALGVTDLAVADRANWTAGVIDQGYQGYSLSWDEVHANYVENQALKNRVRFEVFERGNLQLLSYLPCGSGGYFPTVDAALTWAYYRRTDATRPVLGYHLKGTNFAQTLNGNPSTTRGDGRWLVGPVDLDIEIFEGSTMHIQIPITYNDPSFDEFAAATLRIHGAGTLVVHASANFGACVTDISCAVHDNHLTNASPRGQNLTLGSKLILAGPEDATQSGFYSGILFADNTGNGTRLKAGSTVLQNSAAPIINSRIGATPGVVIESGCALIRADGGVVERTATTTQASTGRVHFYPGCTVSNDTKTSGHTWGGTAPALIDALDL